MLNVELDKEMSEEDLTFVEENRDSYLVSYMEFLVLKETALARNTVVPDEKVNIMLRDFREFYLQYFAEDELDELLNSVGLVGDGLFDFFSEIDVQRKKAQNRVL